MATNGSKNNGKTVHTARKTKGRKRFSTALISPITRKILAVNILALGVLASGILFLDEYKRSLISSELEALATQAEMFAVALAETTSNDHMSGDRERIANISNQMVRRLVQTTGTRARLFRLDGSLAADSRRLNGTSGQIFSETLPPPNDANPLVWSFLNAFETLTSWFSSTQKLQRYAENPSQTAADYPEVEAALGGDYVKALRDAGGKRLLLSVAVPIQRYKQVLGALMLSKSSEKIDAALLDVRINILQIFFAVLTITVLLSFYLARTISRPLLILAAAAEEVRLDHNRHHKIPYLGNRNDEIGELAETLKAMTESLWQRMDAIERFAADVAHELKNPLTSLRSAVETAARIEDTEGRLKLMKIIQEDVVRLDRLISDISDASRLDAELSRADTSTVDIQAMVQTLVDIHQPSGAGAPELVANITVDAAYPAWVKGMESRLAQIFSNLIGNAITFSPENGQIVITLTTTQNRVTVTIDDQGPGIPEGKEKRIFERFYTERPTAEKFGTHSGLGLSISLQIAEAHGGRLWATNRVDSNGKIIGARFSLELPRIDP